jgi:hypothetical protein
MLFLFHSPTPKAETHEPSSPPAEMSARVADNYGKLPLHFEENIGQTDSEVDFVTRGNGYTLYLTSDEAVFMLRQPTGLSSERGPLAPEDVEIPATKYVPLRMGLIGGNPDARAEAVEPLLGVSNYFLGNDPDKWLTDVRHFGAVRYEGVYPGIDVVYHGSTGLLQYDFHVVPGASPDDIRLVFEAVDGLSIDKNGDLLLEVDGTTVRQRAPVSYQEIDGVPVEVASRFVVLEG